MFSKGTVRDAHAAPLDWFTLEKNAGSPLSHPPPPQFGARHKPSVGEFGWNFLLRYREHVCVADRRDLIFHSFVTVSILILRFFSNFLSLAIEFQRSRVRFWNIEETKNVRLDEEFYANFWFLLTCCIYKCTARNKFFGLYILYQKERLWSTRHYRTG